MYCVLQKENLESVSQLPPSFDTWGPETENKPQRGWVLGECQGVSRGMCYAGHGWSVIDSNKGHICVAIKSFNSSKLFHMKRSFTRTVLEQQNR